MNLKNISLLHLKVLAMLSNKNHLGKKACRKHIKPFQCDTTFFLLGGIHKKLSSPDLGLMVNNF